MRKILKNKKIILAIILIIAILLSIYPKVFADPTEEKLTLSYIVEVFNADANKLVDEYKKAKGVTILANSPDEGTIRINVTDSEGTETLEYKIIDTAKSVLESQYPGSGTKLRNYYSDITKILIDYIEQCHGYKPGAMLETFKAKEFEKFTLLNDGLNVIDNPPSAYTAQFNINTRITKIDTNAYFSDENLKEENKKNLAGNVPDSDGIGRVKYFKYNVNNKVYLVVGEQDEFTYRINNSIPTLLKAILGSEDDVKYFLANYPEVKGNKQFEGFKVEVEPILNSTEQTEFGTEDSYRKVRITIDKEAVKTATEEHNKTQENNATQETTPTSTTSSQSTATTNKASNNVNKLPKTGDDNKAGYVSAYVITITAWAILMLIISYAKGKKK